MASIIKAETYEKLRRAIKDDEAVMYLVRDLEEGIEKYLKENAKQIENELYVAILQKIVTKEEFKSEINRLDQKIDFIYQKLNQKIDFVYKDLNNKIQELGKRMEIMYTEINKRMDYQHQALQSEIKRVEQNINTKFWILIGIMILGFTLLNPYTASIIKSLVSFIK